MSSNPYTPHALSDNDYVPSLASGSNPGPLRSSGQLYMIPISAGPRPPKRQRSDSHSEEVLQERKRGSVDAEIHVSPGKPLQGRPGTIHVPSAQVTTGGTFIVSGRDTTSVHNHYYGATQINVLDFMNSIKLPNFRNIQLDTHAKATQGTCGWLTEGEILRIWIENGKILWGTGIPGSGKTIIASIVINHVERMEVDLGSGICLAFVYIRYSEPLSIQDILHSFVAQILERHPDVLPLVAPIVMKHARERTRPTEHELAGILQSIGKAGKVLVFVLDALDELDPRDRRELVDILLRLASRIFITSRPLPPLQACFTGVQSFKIAARPDDILLLVKEYIRRDVELQELLKSPGLESHTISMVQERSDGMFLHARLQLEALRGCSNGQEIRMTLEAFPKDIMDVYQRTWDRIVHKDLVMVVMLWILYAKYELRMEALQHCVSVSPANYTYDESRLVSPSFLLAACCGLVVLDENSGIVRLIHYTTKDFVIPLVRHTFPDPDDTLTRLCIKYLIKCEIPDSWHLCPKTFGLALEKDPFLGYCYHSWDFHAHKQRGSGPPSEVVATFLLSCRRYPFGAQLGLLECMGPLHAVSWFGFETLIPSAARLQPPDARTTGLASWLPLHLACAQGHLKCVEALLKCASSSVLINTKNAFGATPVYTAAIEGRLKIVRLLLECPSVDLNIQGFFEYTPLMGAVAAGHLDIVRLLLKAADIDVNARDGCGGTALIIACQGRFYHVEILRALLECPNVDLLAKDDKGNTALHHACASFCPQISRLLIVPGTSANSLNNARCTPLHIACYRSEIETIQLLLDLPDIEVNARLPEGVTPLMLACWLGKLEIVKLLLLAPGVDVNARSARGVALLPRDDLDGDIPITEPWQWAHKNGGTALTYACFRGHTEIVQLLLQTPQLDVTSGDDDGATPLLIACREGHTDMVRHLLGATGIDINAADSQGQTVLMQALWCGRTDIARLLLQDPGLDKHRADNAGRTAFWYALHRGHSGLAKLLT